jgi:NAD(P)-dependent dehydrogenase (short-subunit alcohol dehydrogenase family)
MRDMEYQTGGVKLDLHFLKMDCEDLQSLKDAAGRFMQQESHLDILINNAGVSCRSIPELI